MIYTQNLELSKKLESVISEQQPILKMSKEHTLKLQLYEKMNDLAKSRYE